MSKLSGYLRLMRPINCLMMGIAVMARSSPRKPKFLWSAFAGSHLGSCYRFYVNRCIHG